MTFREKLDEYAKIIESKAKMVEIIDDDFKEEAVYKIYSADQYKKAYNEHTDAVNKCGNLVSRMSKNNISPTDEYCD